MRFEPLYRAEFSYPAAWGVELTGEHGTGWQEFYVAEGTCSGRLEGRMRVRTIPAAAPTAPTARTSRA